MAETDRVDLVEGSPVLDEPVSEDEGALSSVAVADLADEISFVKQQIQAYHSRAEARERVIDQLHAEVERLRMGEQGTVLRPVVTDLQNLRADLIRQARTLPEEIGRGQVVELLESFALSVELALERCGSVPVRPEIGDKFSGREHRAVKVVEADSAEEDGTIAEVLADGYRATGSDRVLVAAKVHVRRWSPVTGDGAENENEREGNTDV